MTPAERAQLAAVLAQAEAMVKQAEALKLFAEGVVAAVSGTLMGAEREPEPSGPPIPEVKKTYMGRQQVMEGSTKLVKSEP